MLTVTRQESTFKKITIFLYDEFTALVHVPVPVQDFLCLV